MSSQDPQLEFRAIDVDRHADLCVAFRADVFAISFADPERFWREFGASGERYLAWLREEIRKYPDGQLHAWLGEEVVGQIEMRPLADDPTCGYVFLYYVVPAWRGTGIAALLDSQAVAWLRAQGCRRARLSVSETNARAIRFYRRQGWRDTGPRPGKPGELGMERAL